MRCDSGSRVLALLPGFRTLELRQNLQVCDRARQTIEAPRLLFEHHLPLHIDGLRKGGELCLLNGGIPDNNLELFSREGLRAFQVAEADPLQGRQLRLMQL